MVDAHVESGADSLLVGPIEDIHRDLGATFAPFGGWLMPVSYGGTVSEHTAVRTTVGLFDVSHLGKALIAGPGAANFVNSVLTNDLNRIAPGKAQYTLCCNDDGGVIDDIIAYLVSPEEVFLVPNAGNTSAVVALLESLAPEGVSVINQHSDYGVFAVQGPRSADVLAALGLPTQMEYMAFADADLAGCAVRVCRTGYTGEHGYEVLPRWADAATVWRELYRQVIAHDGVPAGLGARDTLRTEMGYPLHGHELSVDITPVQAQVGWAVGWKKPAFAGREALLSERSIGPRRVLRGLKVTGRGIPRDGQAVLRDGVPVGVITSGTFSPTLKAGIALALIDTDSGVDLDSPVEVDVRGRLVAATVVKPPFVVASAK